MRTLHKTFEGKASVAVPQLLRSGIAQVFVEMVENIASALKLEYRNVKQTVESEPSTIATVVVRRIERNQTTSLMILSSISDLLA